MRVRGQTHLSPYNGEILEKKNKQIDYISISSQVDMPETYKSVHANRIFFQLQPQIRDMFFTRYNRSKKTAKMKTDHSR